MLGDILSKVVSSFEAYHSFELYFSTLLLCSQTYYNVPAPQKSTGISEKQARKARKDVNAFNEHHGSFKSSNFLLRHIS